MGERRTRVWRNGVLERRGVDEKELARHLTEKDAVVWLDLCRPGEQEFGVVADLLGLDALAVEDALSDHERAKVDRYPGYLFLNLYETALDPDTGTLTTSELSAFVTANALVTVRSSPGLDLGELTRRWDSPEDLRSFGVGFLLYGLLDMIVDGHFTTVQSMDTELEALESLLFEPGSDDRALQQRSFQLRKSLVLLRRVVLPMREVVNALIRHDTHAIPEGMTAYYQDIYDHVLRATEWTESLRDLVTTILDTRIALQDNRLNQVMKQITAWAAIIAVPTAVTGFYGMNVQYPGYGTLWGFVLSIVVLVVSAVTLFFVFRKRDWL